jgi:hypothetical protein
LEHADSSPLTILVFAQHEAQAGPSGQDSTLPPQTAHAAGKIIESIESRKSLIIR